MTNPLVFLQIPVADILEARRFYDHIGRRVCIVRAPGGLVMGLVQA